MPMLRSKNNLHHKVLNAHARPDFAALKKPGKFFHLLDIGIPRKSPSPGPWTYGTADELVRTCPYDSEIEQIRNDFNIYFERGLIDNGILIPWSCTNGGQESSIMLSMYNIFRLSKYIPFDKNFNWDSNHNNLYEWLKSLDLTAIGFFWAAGTNDYSCGGNKRIYLIGNYLGDPIYRDVINPRSGVGIIDFMVLLVHEAIHAGQNIPHNCPDGVSDTDLNFMGAWAVQYYLLKMLAENTGNYFSDYEKQRLLGRSEDILKTRFCSLK